MTLDDYIRLGKSGLKISKIGLGAWQAGFKVWGKGYTRRDLINAYRYAFDNGINFIDTAEIYGYGTSEEIVGEAIKGYDNIVIATKISGYRVSEHDIIKAADRSRSRLGVDSIDLYQLHWPPPIYNNLCKVLRRLEKTIDMGYVRYIGVSNFTYKLLKKAVECTRKHEIISNQIHYNLVYRVYEKDLIPYMREEGISLIAYSPLGKGVLAGKKKPTSNAQRMSLVFRRGAKDIELYENMKKLSSKYNVSMATISLNWIIKKGGIPIPGVKKRHHVDAILNALRIDLDSRDMELLDSQTIKYREGLDTFTIIRYIPAILQKISMRIQGGM